MPEYKKSVCVIYKLLFLKKLIILKIEVYK